MKLKLLLLLSLATNLLKAQISNEIYGLLRNNAPSELFLSTIDPTDGTNSLIGASLYDSLLVVTGTTFNPYDNQFHVLSADKFFSLDINTGEILNSVEVSIPLENAYMRSIIFNPSDSLYYGLVVQSDTISAAILLSVINPATGDVTILSDSSIATFLMPGRNIIDPFQKVYYLLTDTKIIGVDMYTGEIFSQPEINNPYGAQFDNMSFNCKDGKIYGLVPAIDEQLIYLASIDPLTGLVNLVVEDAIDTTYFISGIATANSAIDPVENIYYYLSAGMLKGLDLSTGATVFETSFYDAEGRYFGLFHHFQDCYGATETRFATNLMNNNPNDFAISPNPASKKVMIANTTPINTITIINALGSVVKIFNPNSNSVIVPVNDLSNGFYYINLTFVDGNTKSKLLIIKN